MPDEVHWYMPDDVEAIPPQPGLYAWYFVPKAGPPDWDKQLDALGRDLGIANFSGFLASHSRRLRLPEMRTSAASAGHLGTEWRGALTEQSSTVFANGLDTLAESGSNWSTLRWALHDDVRRSYLAAVLVQASPRLSNPVYIGVAANLRTRVARHLRDFDNAVEDPTDPRAKNSFGLRAARAEFRREELQVAALPVEELNDLDGKDLRKLAEAAEFVLNRWHRPLLGER